MSKEKWKLLWQRFIHWPGWTGWLKWQGWKKIAEWQGWKAFVTWSGWRKLFVLPALVVFPMGIWAAAALIWVFLTGRETSILAYPIYVFSAYALVTLVAALPGFVKKVSGAVRENPYAQRYLSDQELKFRLPLYFEQAVNFLYGLFKIGSGLLLSSLWVTTDGAYNLVQGGIQLFQILRRRKHLTVQEQWRSYRLCGWMMLSMHLAIAVLVFQMIHLGAVEEHPGYLIFVTALFAFYKLISAFVDVAKDRKHKAPIDSSVRLLNLSQALFSLFSLQVSMIHQFGGSAEFAALMNTLTGGAVCLMVVAMSVYMLRRSGREMKQWEENAVV